MGEFKSPSEKQSAKATPAKKSQENSSVGEADFLDSRSSTFQLKKFQEAAQESGRGSGISQLQTKSSNHTGTSRVAQLQGLSDTRIASEQSALIQKKENKTGIPDGLKAGMESVSGMSLNDVTVHRNSDKPAQLQAHAYAQGTDVHLAPGQEKHLPHELGHVVQQKQGRVAPTVQLKGEVPVNDSPSLEKEADSLGAKAKSLGMTSEAGVAQLKGMEEEEVLQGKFSKDNVAQLEGEDKKKESVVTVDNALTVGSLANSAASAGLGENGKVKAKTIDDKASGIAGNIIASLQSVKALWEKGKAFNAKRDFQSGAEAFLSGADVISNALALASDSGAMAPVPVLGSAIAAFKSGMEVFKSNESLKALRQFEEGKGLSDEEKYILNKKVSSLNIDMASNAADFVLNVVSAVGDFFPPVKAGAAIAQGAKTAFVAAMDAWTSYKSGKEKQAISRISGGDSSDLSAEDQKTAKDLSSKVKADDSKKIKGLKGGSLMDLVNRKMEIEDLKLQILEQTDDSQEAALKSKYLKMQAVLETSIVLYNLEMKKIDPTVSITISDIDNLQSIHANVIREYMNKKVEEKSYWERTKSFLGGPLAPMKDKIMKELAAEGIHEVTDKQISDLSNGIHANALWEKTVAALDTASQGRKILTNAEIDSRMTKILSEHGATKEEIEKIVRKK
jgi:hypothetical protein